MKKLKKVIFKYNDTIEILEGKQVQRWIDKINGMVMLSVVHGGKDFKEFKWKVRKVKNEKA